MKTVSASQLELTKVSWNEMFDSEQELIEKMVEVAPSFRQKGYKGYQYVTSFTDHYQKYGELSPKQITQLKRISKEIYKCLYGY